MTVSLLFVTSTTAGNQECRSATGADRTLSSGPVLARTYVNPSPRRVFLKGFFMLPEAAGWSLLRCGKRPAKAICLYVPVSCGVYRLFFMLRAKYHQGTTCDMHRSPDRVRPSLRLILSGSGNTAWEQISDQDCRGRVCHIYILSSLSGRGLIFYMRTCPQQVRPAPLQGCCLPCRPSFRYATAKSRQRQIHLFLNFMHYAQTIWDKTLLSHCRVIYLSRNMLQQVQPGLLGSGPVLARTYGNPSPRRVSF